MQQYSLSHRLDIPDALIAGKALTNNLELYTLNVKHFKYINKLKLYIIRTLTAPPFAWDDTDRADNHRF